MEITVIGGGLAGVEAAYQVTRMGGRAIIYEMRPTVMTEAHQTSLLAELVCSNSLKSKDLSNAHGLLKEELRRLGSIVLKVADEMAIPGGKALVVDRKRFAERLTEMIVKHPAIHLLREEVSQIDDKGPVIIATGPLTSGPLAENIRLLTGKENLSFFDSISPIIDASTVDYNEAFYASRYMKGEGDYLNCPLSSEEYDMFHEALVGAGRVGLRDFEKIPYFEGCLPVEVLAERGKKTLTYGPMKPVGLIDPKNGRRPYAVVQLRKENASGSMLNMVGFQTKMKYSEQERVFRMVPALKKAVFLRYGSIHRNTYINAPLSLKVNLQSKTGRPIFFAGQLTGVEGYMEATATGLMAGISASLSGSGKTFIQPPATTCIGALLKYLVTENKYFQPMNTNFGLLEGYTKRNKDDTVNTALAAIDEWKKEVFP